MNGLETGISSPSGTIQTAQRQARIPVFFSHRDFAFDFEDPRDQGNGNDLELFLRFFSSEGREELILKPTILDVSTDRMVI